MPTATNVTLSPGLLYVAPIGTTEPASASAALATSWREVGYTDEGSTISYVLNVEAVEVAEELDVIKWATTGREGSVSFAMAETTRRNLALSLNSGANAANDATAIEPPAPGSEVRVMMVYDTEDDARWIFRQCIQAGTIEISNQKAPQKRLIPVEFRLEKPTGLQPFKVFPNAAALI